MDQIPIKESVLVEKGHLYKNYDIKKITKVMSQREETAKLAEAKDLSFPRHTHLYISPKSKRLDRAPLTKPRQRFLPGNNPQKRIATRSILPGTPCILPDSAKKPGGNPQSRDISTEHCPNLEETRR